VKSIITGNDDARLLSRRDTNEIADDWLRKLSVDVGEEFRNLGSIKYWCCDATGFRWYSPAEAAGGGELYSQLEQFDWYYMLDKWEFSAALGLLEGADTLLEVGVGAGHFLHAAREQGHAVVGVELNPRAAKRVRHRGFEVHELTLQDLSAQTEKRVDTICSFQVLEHVPDPCQFIEGMISILKPGGRIIISVPNAAIMRKLDPDNRDLLNQPPHHMGHWDESVFRALENYMPLKVRSVVREPMAIYHIRWMVNGYLRNYLSPLGKGIPRFLVNRYSTLPLQWLMRLGLRKIFPGHTLLVELEYQPD